MAELDFKDANHLAHAYIISARTQEESLAEAMKIASAAMCEGKGKIPCGICRACRKIKSGVMPDLIKIGRIVDDKGKAKKEISVEQIRQIRSDAAILPNEAKRKVYVIEDADCMNVPAQNAALKLLEEPPNGAMFLLCVKNPQLLLATVRSRCAEISIGSQGIKEDGENETLALSYLRAVSGRKRDRLLLWCSHNEGMDGRSAAEFTDALGEVIADMLCKRRPDMGFSDKELMELSALCEKCVTYLKVNVGVKHIFGLLAVDSIPEAEKEEQ